MESDCRFIHSWVPSEAAVLLHWVESKLHRAPLTVRGESQEWICGGQDEGNGGERAGGVGRI